MSLIRVGSAELYFDILGVSCKNCVVSVDACVCGLGLSNRSTKVARAAWPLIVTYVWLMITTVVAC